MVHPPTQEDE
jgi:hypothetical protein